MERKEIALSRDDGLTRQELLIGRLLGLLLRLRLLLSLEEVEDPSLGRQGSERERPSGQK